MGIKHFWLWFSKKHKDCITSIQTDTPLPRKNIRIDTLALDMNGIFHPAAQKIFKYGAHSPKLQRLLQRKHQKHNEASMQKLRLACFEEVCNMIDELVEKVQPRKRLLLCVDGVAGCSKQSQQRSRRFKSAKEQADKHASGEECKFDSCSITPGTKFMHHLNKYIDWYARHKIQNGDWAHLDVVFSSEKVPGEGEHKCLALFTSYCDPAERMMIYGLDADLIMLCLSTGLPNIYIYRDNMYNPKERFVIDIGKFAKNLKRDLRTKSAVTDFVFMCFMVGNDFLPQIPGLEILNNGIEILLDLYREVCTSFGLIKTDDYTIRLGTFFKFCEKLSVLELDALKQKYKIRRKYHQDDLLEDHFHYSRMYEDMNSDGTADAVIECDFTAYKRAYYAKKLNIHTEEEINTLCQEYIKGLHWVVQYYNKGIPSWTWTFPYNYGPFMDDLYRCTGYVYHPYIPTRPLDSFEQLLAVLPPQSNELLPQALRKVMTSEMSPLSGYYPQHFEVDLSGKRAEWEGIALLPIMDFKLLRKTYNDLYKYVPLADQRLNRREKTIRYVQTDQPELWKSYYGNIPNCTVRYETL